MSEGNSATQRIADSAAVILAGRLSGPLILLLLGIGAYVYTTGQARIEDGIQKINTDLGKMRDQVTTNAAINTSQGVQIDGIKEWQGEAGRRLNRIEQKVFP